MQRSKGRTVGTEECREGNKGEDGEKWVDWERV